MACGKILKLTINFGELDYANDDVQRPFMIIKPLNCVLRY